MYRNIEELALNGWPALQTTLMDGWLLRTAEGYTKRSNSVSPLYGGGEDSTEVIRKRIRAAEQFYRTAGQDAIFKITPFAQPEILDMLLQEDGYDKVEPSSVRLLDAEAFPEPGKLWPEFEMRLEEVLSDRWLHNMANLNQLSEPALETTRKLVVGSLQRKCFATLSVQGEPAACGLAVLERGYIGLYDIVVHPARRSRGIGQELITQLLQWGKAVGADACYLQVVQSNTPANRLYDKLGFKEIYSYWYRVKRSGSNEL
ncbi:GNAT family N-acetyltransferase [Paenibacillus nasutitermitis]|uniref:N-acetyltransferase GCN5 n=1 Tax=Paenibacillus nasutitermitis TaxID=1652958 RepID=A0A916YQE6_9BACL|nr:GNAT family N-acetyltransferase [Paenibacillus nasutitermitis]GGD55781.1 N-acetyltransferase GCN5 [Paenibacillus nasutitermitis]